MSQSDTDTESSDSARRVVVGRGVLGRLFREAETSDPSEVGGV
jgi:hypothetical protein